MDTTGLTGGMLRRRVVTELLGPKGARGKLALTIITFGFKNGPPREADVMLDVRFLPNPHYREDLRPLTGLDAQVIEYVEAGELAREFYDRLFPLLDFVLPAYETEGKAHLTIAIGCTGGRHRSLVVADRIATHLADHEDVSLRIVTGTSSWTEARMAEPVISVGGLRKSYGELEAVRGIDLQVTKGEIFAFLGPNGAGKTTTVEILEGYRSRTAGEVTVLGADPPVSVASGASGWGSCSRTARCIRSSRCESRWSCSPAITAARATSPARSISPGLRGKLRIAWGGSPVVSSDGSTWRSH